MKTITRISLAVFMIAATALQAQDAAIAAKPKVEREKPRTLFSGEEIYLSGYGAPIVSFSPVGDKYGVFTGMRGALLINDNWGIGFSGYGLVYPKKRATLSGGTYTGTEPYARLGYGGLLLEYHIAPKNLFHVAIGTTIGGGSLIFTDRKSDDDGSDENTGDIFFAIEPEVTLYVNLTRFCRVGAGVSYRFVNGISGSEFTDKDFRAPSASIIAAFGWF